MCLQYRDLLQHGPGTAPLLSRSPSPASLPLIGLKVLGPQTSGWGGTWGVTLHIHTKHILSPFLSQQLPQPETLLCMISSVRDFFRSGHEMPQRLQHTCKYHFTKYVHNISRLLDFNNSRGAKQPNGALRNKWSRKKHLGSGPQSVCLSVWGASLRSPPATRCCLPTVGLSSSWDPAADRQTMSQEIGLSGAGQFRQQ